MKNAIKNNASLTKSWYEKNLSKLFLLVVIHSIVFSLTQLPYVNVIVLLFPGIVYFVDLIMIIFLFHPKKEYLLKTAVILFILAVPFSFVKLFDVVELLGQISFFLLVAFLLQVSFRKS